MSGFDHTSFDNVQEAWHTHNYPCKLGGYRKRILSTPVCITEIDYNTCTLSGELSDEQQKNILYDNRKKYESVVPIVIAADGRCDCFALWIDYSLTSSIDLQHYDESVKDFPHYFKLLLRFLPNPVQVFPNDMFETSCTFFDGQSDFELAFRYNKI